MSIAVIKMSDEFSLSAQIQRQDIDALAEMGVRSLLCSRPDGEANDQPTFAEVQAAASSAGLQVAHVPVISGKVNAQNVDAFIKAFDGLEKPVHGFCRTGTRSLTLWSFAQRRLGVSDQILLARARANGFDLAQALGVNAGVPSADRSGRRKDHYDVVIVGAGAAGISVASSLRARNQSLSIAIIDPAQVHYYQPGWTLVGAGVFTQEETVKTTASLIPDGVTWIQGAVGDFEPDENRVLLEDARPVYYDRLVAAPGIKLDWHGVDGLVDTLGQNGVTSNYRFDLAPYTWELVQSLRAGRAIFTQPPMPIKCAGAPQKALYLSADHWKRHGVLRDVEVAFYNAGQVLFGVKEYVPALMEYMKAYDAQLNFGFRLVRVDGPSRTAWFETENAAAETVQVSTEFDMLHVCPPQVAPDVVRHSPLADAGGWIDVDQNTLQHKRYDNVWGVGDAMNAPNAKTAAAARMQAPIVANNLLEHAGFVSGVSHYNGYGSCPLTVERGKIVLAEFGYGGKLLPSFPSWIINGQRPSRMAWLLKERILPPVYWKAMLKGREWMVNPDRSKPVNSNA